MANYTLYINKNNKLFVRKNNYYPRYLCGLLELPHKIYTAKYCNNQLLVQYPIGADYNNLNVLFNQNGTPNLTTFLESAQKYLETCPEIFI